MMAIYVLALPLLGALICGLGWRIIGEGAAVWSATVSITVACLMAWSILLNSDGSVAIYLALQWIESGTFSADFGVRLDRVTMIFMVLATSISAAVHLFSIQGLRSGDYFEADEVHAPRFVGLVSLLTFAMIALVTSYNLVQLIFGWLLAGWTGAQLIGFRYRTTMATVTATGEFATVMVGSVALILAAGVVFAGFDTVRMMDVATFVPDIGGMTVSVFGRSWPLTELVGGLVFVAAMTIAAQAPLHMGWVDAADTPSPAAALLQSGTLAVAGIFVLIRFSPILEAASGAQSWIVTLGVLGACFTALCALVQSDLRRALAFLASAQVGLIMVAVGSGAYSVALWLVVAFTLSQALLVLGAGSVIRAMGGAGDMLGFGGLRQKMPVTFWAMVTGAVAVAGIGVPGSLVGMGGFAPRMGLSTTTLVSAPLWVFWAVMAASFGIAMAAGRVVFLTFSGSPRGPKDAFKLATESSTTMLVPLAALAVAAILAGSFWQPAFYSDTSRMKQWFGMVHVMTGKDKSVMGTDAATENKPLERRAFYISPANTVLEKSQNAPAWVSMVAALTGVLGFVFAWRVYARGAQGPARLAKLFRPHHSFLGQGGFAATAIAAVLARPALSLGRLLEKWGDHRIIDGTVNAMAGGLAKLFGKSNSGARYTFVCALVIGTTGLLVWMTGGGAG